jgi:hypothetical protein
VRFADNIGEHHKTAVNFGGFVVINRCNLRLANALKSANVLISLVF